MACKLDLEARMTIKELRRRGWSRCAIARALGVTEGAVRYHLRRQAEGRADGRARQVHLAASYHDAILAWLEGQTDERLNLAALHDHLVEEHGYPGSLRSIQRYFRARFPGPKRRARRRVETPPGAQAQVDWARFPRILVAGRRRDLYGFHMQLSHSRFAALVWSESKDQLAWHHVHNEALRRLEGVPATLRVDNEKTAIARGAGAWGEINAAYRRYAQTVRFHVDACPPRAPHTKGKVERRIRDHRLRADPSRRHWRSLEELQGWSDERLEHSARRRVCPPTGTRVWEAWREERRYLAPLPVLPEPFDLVATRTVTADCLVAFEGRSYSVPFQLLGQPVEVRGCAGRVQVLYGARIVAVHPRHTRRRLLLDPGHFEGEATAEILPPPPLGRMGRRLAEIGALVPEQRPLDLYAALAEVAR
jgi:transposase